MAACAKCKVVCEDSSNRLECGKCRNLFHPICVGLMPEAVPKIAEELQRGVHWLCQTCVGKISLYSVYAHPELTRMKLDMVAEVQASVKLAIASVQNKAEATAEELKELKQQHTLSVMELSKRVQTLELHQSSHIQEVSFRVDDVHRQLRRDEVVIMKVPFKENEDLRKHFLAILMTLQLPPEHFANVLLRRISRPNSQGASSRSISTPPIVVAFESRYKRNEFMKAYFQKANLSLKDLGFPSDGRIYINENLSAQNYSAFQQAMGWKREKKIHSVKVSDGMVFVTTSKEAKPIRIFQHTSLWNKDEFPQPPQLTPKPTVAE